MIFWVVTKKQNVEAVKIRALILIVGSLVREPVVARELDRAQNESRKDRPRDKTEAAQQHAPVPALT